MFNSAKPPTSFGINNPAGWILTYMHTWHGVPAYSQRNHALTDK